MRYCATYEIYWKMSTAGWTWWQGRVIPEPSNLRGGYFSTTAGKISIPLVHMIGNRLTEMDTIQKRNAYGYWKMGSSIRMG